MPFRPDTFGPFLDAVDAARQAPILTRRSLEGTALALKIDSQLLRNAGQSVAVMPLRNVTDPQRVAVASSDAADAIADATPTGDVELSPIQRRFFASAGPEASHFNQSLSFEVAETLEASAVSAAVGLVSANARNFHCPIGWLSIAMRAA